MTAGQSLLPEFDQGMKTTRAFRMTCARIALFGILGAAACRKGEAGPGPQDLANALVTIPETGVPLAVYQRFKYRHQILDSMRANLRALVAAESAYHVDSGKYSYTTSCLPHTEGTAHWCASRENTLGSITMSPHGWSATISNINTAIFCAVQIGNDTSFGAPSGVPACFGTQPGQTRSF